MPELLAQTIIASPIGKIAIAATDNGIAKIDILTNGMASEFVLSEVAEKLCSNAAKQLAEYFAGSRQVFELEFDLVGTEFQKSVWQRIAEVPFGQTLGYGAIATSINNPLASRAVGGAVGANPVPLVIGCHRVLGSNKRITGYSGGEGLKTKRWLLKHEGIDFKDE